MKTTARTSAEKLQDHFPGELVAAGRGQAWQELLVEIHSRPGQHESIMVPAVPEPQIVWLLRGNIVLEEREIGGEWNRLQVETDDLFLTTSPEPYEVRWQNLDPTPALVMQVYVGLPLLLEAARDLSGEGSAPPRLREFSGKKDPTISALLEQLRLELVERPTVSPLFIQSIGRALAIQLVRNYADSSQSSARPRAGLTAFQLNQVTQFIEAKLGDSFQLADLASQIGLSEFHFSRLFKKTTGLAPSRYILRQKVAQARRLLRETDKSVLEIGLEVGYSSASHFTEVFRRETGVTPSDYRNRL